jgi:hypothetical protein
MSNKQTWQRTKPLEQLAFLGDIIFLFVATTVAMGRKSVGKEDCVVVET